MNTFMLVTLKAVLLELSLLHASIASWVKSDICHSSCDQPRNVDVSFTVRGCCTHLAVPKGYLPDVGRCNGFNAFCFSSLDQPMEELRENFIKILYLSGLTKNDKILRDYQELLKESDNLLPPLLLDVDTDGLEFIMDMEGFTGRFTNERLAAIGTGEFEQEEAKHTIGYGTNCTRYAEYCEELKSTGQITKEVAVKVLRSILKLEVERVVKGLVKVYLSQTQFNALASFVYHIGEELFKKSNVLVELNAENLKNAAMDLYMWNVLSANGKVVGISEPLRRRREKEAELFCSDVVCSKDEWERDEL